MTSADHERARRLIAESTLESCGAADTAWLDEHLAACSECRREAAGVASAVASLRDISIPAPAALAARTRAAWHRRAAETTDRRHDQRLLAFGLAFSIVSTAVTLPFAWWTCEWLGRALALPNPIWQAGFLVSWFFPATVAAAVLAWPRLADARGFGSGQAYTW